MITPTDDLYDRQWYLGVIGDLEVIWRDYSGADVLVGIYDDGVDRTHSDLAPNYDTGAHVVVGGTPADPSPADGAHGTAVAGIIGAAMNGSGIVGVAHQATLSGVNIFSGPASTGSGFNQAIEQLGTFDVTNHSWGYSPWTASSYISGQALDFEASLVTGRDGLGTINVKAAGNDNDNSNGEAIDASRATISVGAYGNDGDTAGYSNYGANLLVSAPSSGGTQGQTTTDLVGGAGYSGGDFTNSFGGTSGASPVVAGVAALMLDADPGLGWRDVHTILAYSATGVGTGYTVDVSGAEDFGWFTNAAGNWNGGGLHFSEDYGYGSVNAYNAVRMAEVWSLFSDAKTSANEASIAGMIGPAAIADQSSIELTVEVGQDFALEAVDIDLSVTHSFFSDLTIDLISPGETSVRLFDGEANGDFADLGVDWSFGAQSFRGENAAGTWTLRIADTVAGDAGTLDGATLTFYGESVADTSLADEVFHFTGEFGDSAAADATRLDIDGGGGIDWLDAAATARPAIIDLAAGTAWIDGTMASVQGIEHIVSGDGRDRLSGDASANELHGMRGHDSLYGGGGHDVLEGHRGSDTLDGGAGNDRMDGGAQDDTLFGDQGADILRGSDGADTLSGDRGPDRLFGDVGDDQLYGGVGNDKILGGRSHDALDGGAGRDFLNGNQGHDVVDGGTGDDTVYGGFGNDIVRGEAGDDVIGGGWGADTLTGGEGSDTFFYDRGDAQDIITDWEDGVDMLDFSSLTGVRARSDITIDVEGADTLVYANGDRDDGFLVLASAGLIDNGDILV